MKDVEQVVGSHVVAGSLVTSKGRAKSVMGGALAGAAGGVLARAAAQAAGEHSQRGASPLPVGPISLGYLAVTEQDMVLVAGQQGLVGAKAKEVVASVERSRVAAAAWGKGALARPLTLTFDDGTTWELEVPRANVKQAEAVIRELGVPADGTCV